MRTRTLVLSATMLAVVAVPATATARQVGGDTAVTDRISAIDLEPIRLECAVRHTDSRAAIGCAWSEPTSPRAAQVRLFRLDPAVDDHRRVVFRTSNLSETQFVDRKVRHGHRYAYAVVVVDDHGRVVGRSRAEWVRVPAGSDESDVEPLRLECALGPARETVACRWTRPTSRDAAVVNLWRSVNDGPRELVEQFRPSGPNEYRDPVPAGAVELTYVVTASSTTDRLIARSRPETIRLRRLGDAIDRSPVDVVPVDVVPVDVVPVDVVPVDVVPVDVVFADSAAAAIDRRADGVSAAPTDAVADGEVARSGRRDQADGARRSREATTP